MTDNEIIKALECHKEATVDNCFECPYVGSLSHSYSSNCIHKMMVDTLDLINRQKAEIERLSHKCDDCAGCTQWNCDCANIGAAAIKEFAERLKGIYAVHDGLHMTIDNLVKEMVGE